MTDKQLYELDGVILTLQNRQQDASQYWDAATNEVEENYYEGRLDAFNEALSYLYNFRENLREQPRVSPPGGTE